MDVPQHYRKRTLAVARVPLYKQFHSNTFNGTAHILECRIAFVDWVATHLVMCLSQPAPCFPICMRSSVWCLFRTLGTNQMGSEMQIIVEHAPHPRVGSWSVGWSVGPSVDWTLPSLKGGGTCDGSGRSKILQTNANKIRIFPILQEAKSVVAFTACAPCKQSARQLESSRKYVGHDARRESKKRLVALKSVRSDRGQGY